jgi:hypothetical protein
MCYLLGPVFAQDYGNNVKTEGSVLDVVCGEKITGGPEESIFLCRCYNRFGRGKGFIGPGLYLDKNNRTIGIDHNEVDFTGFAGEVSGEFSEALSFQKPLAAFFAPSTKKFVVGP